MQGCHKSPICLKKKKEQYLQRTTKQSAIKRGTLVQLTTWTRDWHLKCWQICGNEPLTCRIHCHLWIDFLMSGKDTQLVLENSLVWGNTQHTHTLPHTGDQNCQDFLTGRNQLSKLLDGHLCLQFSGCVINEKKKEVNHSMYPTFCLFHAEFTPHLPANYTQ